jgi:hypothetical protein
MSEYNIKRLLEEFDYLLNTDHLQSLSNENNEIITILKKYSSNYLDINLQLEGNNYKDFHDLQCLRNTMVHSGSSFWLQRKRNIEGVTALSKRYLNVKLDEENIWINREFCKESVEIVRKFFFHICKVLMRNFPG